MYCVWRSNLGKLIAPRMRRAFKREVLEDFVSSDMTPMEERDPELVINPIFVHKMQRQREKQRAKKVKKMGVWSTTGVPQTASCSAKLAPMQMRGPSPKGR